VYTSLSRGRNQEIAGIRCGVYGKIEIAGKGEEGGMAEAVTSATWEQEVLKAPGLVLVDFWAVWCGPCRMVAPIVDEISKEYEGKLKVMKLNTDENPDVAGKYRIMGIPTLMFFKGGQTVDQVVGAVPKAQLKSKVDALLAK
jgi:thioredoxin 1